MITCPRCNSTDNHYKSGRSDKGEPIYRCKSCSRKFTQNTKLRGAYTRLPRNVIPCLHCGTETKNPKFCSSRCAAIHNNTISPKRKGRKDYFCKYCGVKVSHRCETCKRCNGNIVDWSTRTMGEMRQAPSYQVNARIRTLARSVYRKSDKPKYCMRCGYAKYYEVCHIIGISDFPDDTPVSVVNDINNLMALCPNCHWELDHGLLACADGVFYEVSK